MSRAFFGAFGKRCHVQICCLRQKMSRNFEGRISRAQSALEQAYQNFCTNSREAGGLPLMKAPFHRCGGSLSGGIVAKINQPKSVGHAFSIIEVKKRDSGAPTCGNAFNQSAV